MGEAYHWASPEVVARMTLRQVWIYLGDAPGAKKGRGASAKDTQAHMDAVRKRKADWLRAERIADGGRRTEEADKWIVEGRERRRADAVRKAEKIRVAAGGKRPSLQKRVEEEQARMAAAKAAR